MVAKIGKRDRFRIDKNTCIIGTVVEKVELGRRGGFVAYKIRIQSDAGILYPDYIRIKEKERPFKVNTSAPKVKPYTERQLNKICSQCRADLKADGYDDSRLQDACPDVAEGLLLTDPRVKAYFRKEDIPEMLWRECLADRIYG